MAFTSADLDTIDAAIASGVRKVTFADGRATEYQSTSEMLAAKRVIAGQLVLAEQKLAGISRSRFATFSPGL